MCRRGRVLDLQLQAGRMEVKDLKVRLETTEGELEKVTTDKEHQLSEAFVQAARSLCKKDKDVEAALSEAKAKAVPKFKSSVEFQQYLATQSQEGMITMLLKV